MDMHQKFWEIYDEYIHRQGADSLKEWILSTDAETAPASTRFHGSYAGGWMDHSVHVWEELVRLLKAYPEIKVSGETAAVIALGHDLCKLNTYSTELRNTKVNGVWVHKPIYVFKEKFAYGSHGGKSVYLLQKHIDLSDEEAVAIACHMGFTDRSPSDYSLGNAYEQHPIAWLLHVADESATYIREGSNE